MLFHREHLLICTPTIASTTLLLLCILPLTSPLTTTTTNHRHYHRHHHYHHSHYYYGRGKTQKEKTMMMMSMMMMLPSELRSMYRESGTLGVLHGVTSYWTTRTRVTTNTTINSFHDDDHDHNDDHNDMIEPLIEVVLDAARSRHNKGEASGIMNGILGACCCSRRISSRRNSSQYAIDCMTAYDRITDLLKPNLVSFCLAYTATYEHDEAAAEEFLDRASQLYEKKALSLRLLQDDDDDDDDSSCRTANPNWNELERVFGIQMLQDTKDYVVVSKPSGMVCYGTGGGSATLEQCLLEHGVPLSTLNEVGRGFVHRLDRGTSGVMVLAKTNAMHARLVTQFFLRKVKKSYEALVCLGKEGNHLSDSGTIHLPIQGRPAVSSYIVTERRIGSHMAKLRVRTAQGRKHQVRLHCSKGLGLPIVLDPRYGGEKIMFQIHSSSILSTCRSRNQFCLHANSLSIPEYGIEAKAPLPDWWNGIMEEARLY